MLLLLPERQRRRNPPGREGKPAILLPPLRSGDRWKRRRGHGQLQGMPVLPGEPDHPGRGLARGAAEENELGRPAAGIHKMGEEQAGCGEGRVFIHRRSRRDQNVVPLVDRQPKPDGGVALPATSIQAQQRGGTVETGRVQPVNSAKIPIASFVTGLSSIWRQDRGAVSTAWPSTDALPGRPRGVRTARPTRSTISMSPETRSGVLAAECSSGRTASMSIETETCG